jgi:hypothetical protein
VLTAMTALSGCGGGDDKAACDAIKAEIKNVTTQGMQQIDNGPALAKTYTDGAAKVRAEGKKAGGDVESGADAMATAMEEMSKGIAAGSGQMPDTSKFISAGVKVNDACT